MARRRMSKSRTHPPRAGFDRALEMNKRMMEAVYPPTTAEELVQVLNGSSLAMPSKSRVKRIIQLLQKYQAFFVSMGGLGMWRNAKTQAERERLIALASAIPGDWLDLNDLLSRYWVSPRIIPYNGAPRIAYLVKSKGSSKTQQAESGAVMGVVHLALQDELDRVRGCDCGKFFFAHRIDQRYCSTKCRVRFYQSSEEFREKRRIYLRKLYRLKRSGKVK
jgi:hypothetical protein